MAMVVGALGASVLWVTPVSARSTGTTRAAHRCHTTGRHHCASPPVSESVTGSNGGLTVTFTATASGSTVDFDISYTEAQAYGAVGPAVLSFGDGTSQGWGIPQYCTADPTAVSGDRQVTHDYESAGTYSSSVTVVANCTPDHVTLTLPVTAG